MQATARQTINAKSVIGALSQKIDSAAYASWIAPCEISVQNNCLSVVAPNQFSADYIRSVYLGLLESFGMPVNIVAASVAAPSNDNELKVFVPTPNPEPRTTNHDFICSDENAFVVSACKKMADGAATFSPLFIYGSTGCGKTMLAESVATAGKSLMMTGGQFVAEFARSLRENTAFAFKDFCRKCDTFILDDVHVLSGKRATADEFMNLLTDLIAQKKNVVLTSNAAPGALSGFDRRLQSIMASGLVADVAAPTQNVKKLMLERAGVAPDVAEILASRLNGDGHLISGVAKKIATYAELMGERVTVAVAEKLLSDTLAKNKTPTSMVKSMCEKLGVSYDAVCGTTRTRTIVRARMIMMTALKSATKLSLSEIGTHVGGRDHATVLYAISQIEKMRGSDLILSAEINQMIEVCR